MKFKQANFREICKATVLEKVTQRVFNRRCLCASWKLLTTTEEAKRDYAHTQEKSLNELTAVLYIEAIIVAAIAEIFIEIDMYVHHTVNRDM